MDLFSLGLRIRRQRRLLHLRQDELAERAGISVSFLGHIERGTRKAGLETLILLANALGISTDILLQESLNDDALQGITTRQRAMLGRIADILCSDSHVWGGDDQLLHILEGTRTDGRL